MRRRHLWEFNDLPWFPQVFRDALTAYLGTLEGWSKPYHAVHPLILDAIRQSGGDTVVDLCTGNGISALALRESALASGLRLKWVLTDFYPKNRERSSHFEAAQLDVEYIERPIDAREPPLDCAERAFRTVFTAFHHFGPSDASRILQNAVDAGSGIAVAEFTHRSIGNCAKYLLAPALACLVMTTIRPIRWDWLCFTFLIPVLPFLIAWDGLVSNLRTYSPHDLDELVLGVPGNDRFTWQIGEVYGSGMFPVITYLIGQPRRADSRGRSLLAITGAEKCATETWVRRPR